MGWNHRRLHHPSGHLLRFYLKAFSCLKNKQGREKVTIKELAQNKMIYVHVLLTRRSICNLTDPACKFQQIKQKILGSFHFADSLTVGGKRGVCVCVCVGGTVLLQSWGGHQGMQGFGQSRIYDSRVPSDTCISVVYVVNCEEHGRES